jgi:hypothetical protein
VTRDDQLIKGKVPRLSDSNLGLAGNEADDVYCSSVRPSVGRSVVRQRGAPSSRPLKVGLRDERAPQAKGKRSRGRGQQAQEEEKKRKDEGRKEASVKTGKEGGRKEGGRGERLKGREGKGREGKRCGRTHSHSDFI